MSKSWVTFVHSTATAHAKCELDALDDNFSSHLDWLSDLENLEHRHTVYTADSSAALATPTSKFEDQLYLKMATTYSKDQQVPQTSFDEEDQTNNDQDATIMENIQVPCKEALKPSVKDAVALSSGNIVQDPSRLADFIKDFFPDYQLEDIMTSPMKSQQNDVGLPSPPLSKPPSPVPPVTGSITPTDESPCDTKYSQNLLPNDDPFREYFEEKLSASNWSFNKGARPPPPTYSKALPAKHKLLQQADVENAEAKKITHFTNSSDTKSSSKTTQIDGSKSLLKHTVDQVHESMKTSLPHARLTTLAKYDIDVPAVPLKSRLLQMAEKADSKQGKPTVSKALASSEKRTSQALSMERINRLAQPKRIAERIADNSKSIPSSYRSVSKSPTKTSVSQKAQGAKHLGVSQIRQKRSQPMSLTAAAIALNSTPILNHNTTSLFNFRRSVDSGAVAQETVPSNEPDWARESNLEAALEEQSKVDPDEIFGKITSLEIDDVFRTKPSKLQALSPSRPFRIRVNSCMTRVTHQEEAAYRIAMGYAAC
ncbi:hypothetical protein BGW37DRAFT_816 [Umbelopsis sp. PMI_123]|nr:hypothetical protein BGW37DRAFT_816 [Umbelopsis sp. PMI_123]